jgi:hypothetical protein
MLHAKQASSRRHKSNKAVPVLGAARLSLSTDMLTPKAGVSHVTLCEEEISEVSLATFYVFDNENARRLHQQLARGGGRCAGGGCACFTGCGG